MAALTTLKRREAVSEFEMEVYAGKTAHVPTHVLSQAVSRLLEESTWFPTIRELLEACERIRLEMRAALKFSNCVNCREGWSEVTDERGDKRLKRCACWLGHQQKVQALGVPEKPLALPAVQSEEVA